MDDAGIAIYARKRGLFFHRPPHPAARLHTATATEGGQWFDKPPPRLIDGWRHSASQGLAGIGGRPPATIPSRNKSTHARMRRGWT